MSRIVYVNGEYLPEEEATVSVFDSGFLLGDGVWEGIRLHNNKLAFLEEHLDRLIRDLPLKRRGYPGDIADATLYLLGASFVTGQVIFVDGGRHIRLGGTA